MEEIDFYGELFKYGVEWDLQLSEMEVVFGRPVDSFDMTSLVDKGLKVSVDPECPYVWVIRRKS